MNVIKLCGGLGNQFFQYAFGQAMTTNVGYDISWYETPNKDRSFLLNNFNLNIEICNMFKKRVKRDDEFNLDILDIKGYNFVGYWQSPLYFKDIMPLLKQEFTVKKELYTNDFESLKKDISECNSVGIHVRRGDFLQSNAHIVMPLSYYLAGIEIMYSLVDNPVFYVFSDDMEWCKENFKGVNFVHLSPCLDFELLKTCKHKIIPNSTFSWWASFLNSDIVICPKIWYRYFQDYWVEERQLLPNNWIKLNV